MTWRDRAACFGIPIEQFFPSHGKRLSPAAKRACAGCPVRQACLAEALDDPDVTEADKRGVGGFRGGMTSKARHSLRQGRVLTVEDGGLYPAEPPRDV